MTFGALPDPVAAVVSGVLSRWWAGRRRRVQADPLPGVSFASVDPLSGDTLARIEHRILYERIGRVAPRSTVSFVSDVVHVGTKRLFDSLAPGLSALRVLHMGVGTPELRRRDLACLSMDRSQQYRASYGAGCRTATTVTSSRGSCPSTRARTASTRASGGTDARRPTLPARSVAVLVEQIEQAIGTDHQHVPGLESGAVRLPLGSGGEHPDRQAAAVEPVHSAVGAADHCQAVAGIGEVHLPVAGVERGNQGGDERVGAFTVVGEMLGGQAQAAPVSRTLQALSPKRSSTRAAPRSDERTADDTMAAPSPLPITSATVITTPSRTR